MKIFQKKPKIRFLKELEKVIFDKKWLEKKTDFPLYYMFRGLKERGDLRYDITIIPPAMLGEEYVKTKGHFHLGNFGELYKVLAGEGIFLLQKGKRKIEDVYFVRGKRGDYIIVPPFYGHTTINPTKRVLKIANWISKNCSSDYLSVEKMGGFCYYYTLGGWKKNGNYKKIPKLKEKLPSKKMPKNFSFLYG